MVFWIILLVLFLTGFITSIVVECNYFDCEGWLLASGFGLLACCIIFSLLMMQRKTNISSYREAKAYPEYFTNEQRIKNNEVIANIKAHHGTIFSFYNGIEFEYFEIEDGSKVIIKE